MAENVLVVNFDVESEAYQAMTEIRKAALTTDYTFSQACLVKNEDGKPVIKDQFDTGIETANDTGTGAIVGTLVGIVGGPIGMLLGGSMGLLVGSTIDAEDAVDNGLLITQVCSKIADGKTVLIGLVSEAEPGSVDKKFEKFAAHVTKLDAAEVAAEVEEALELERRMREEARKAMLEEKKQAGKAKVEEYRAKITEAFDNLKKKISG